MQLLSGRLVLSPCDLNDHVECAHLTTLALEFLFSRCRLNGAVSRAQRLLESRARTIEQMRLINALCRFVEMAEGQTSGCSS